MSLVDDVRAHAASVAAGARSVRIDPSRMDAVVGPDRPPPPSLDPVRHYLEGSEEDVARFLLTVDAINFGSGWFPTLVKRVDPATGATVSGATTIAWAVTERFRAHGPWTNAQLRAMRTDELADVMGQRRDHELMALYAQALRQLGRFLGARDVLAVVGEARGSAVAFAEALVAGGSMWADAGFFKRAQLAASDLALAGVAFGDLDALTIFADNLVPHVLRCEGVLVYDDVLAARIDGGFLLPPGPWEREIRACAVHACEELARRLEVAPRTLDTWLWDRGQRPEFKARPRHRSRCIYY